MSGKSFPTVLSLHQLRAAIAARGSALEEGPAWLAALDAALPSLPSPPSLSEPQKAALRAAHVGAIRAPAQGAYRRASGEVNGVDCFDNRTLTSLVKKKLLTEFAPRAYALTEQGRAALKALNAPASGPVPDAEPPTADDLPLESAVGWVNPQSLGNIDSGRSAHEWLWAKPSAGDVPLYAQARPVAAITPELPDWARRALAHQWRLDENEVLSTWSDIVATLGVGIPGGWKLVPVEPTDDMIRRMLVCEFPATYGKALFTEHDGEHLIKTTQARIRRARAQYAAALDSSPSLEVL